MKGFKAAVGTLLAAAGIASAQTPMSWPAPYGYPGPMYHPGYAPVYVLPPYPQQPMIPLPAQPFVMPEAAVQNLTATGKKPVQTAVKPVRNEVLEGAKVDRLPESVTTFKPITPQTPQTPQAPAAPVESTLPAVPDTIMPAPADLADEMDEDEGFRWFSFDAERRRDRRLWCSADYLMWWIQDQPMPSVLATRSNPGAPFPGVLGQPGTSILFGGQDIELGTFTGVRSNLGFWIDYNRTIGLELGGFILERRAKTFRVESNALGEPFLGVPFFDAISNQENAVAVALPGFASGAIDIQTNTRLWSADINSVINLTRGDYFVVDVFVGGRYLDLREQLILQTTQSALAPLNLQARTKDSFLTLNRIYGAQVGGRLDFQHGPFVFMLQNKTVLGANSQKSENIGSTAVTGLNPVPLTVPNGLLVQTSNTGGFSRNRFVVVNEAEARVGLVVMPHVTVFAGYDFLYATNVVRPGNQIDRVINFSQNPLIGGGVLIGPARPSARSVTSTFYAHGVSAGFELAF